jgi:hypothetical protein
MVRWSTDHFIGLSLASAEQTESTVALHLDQYMSKAIEEYKTFAEKSLRPKRTPSQRHSGSVLSSDDSPVTPNSRMQTNYCSKLAHLQIN